MRRRRRDRKREAQHARAVTVFFTFKAWRASLPQGTRRSQVPLASQRFHHLYRFDDMTKPSLPSRRRWCRMRAISRLKIWSANILERFSESLNGITLQRHAHAYIRHGEATA